MKNNVFKYPDTNSTRAGIDMLNQQFNALKVAIVGLGGTGSYILDLVSKVPVQEIHLYDADVFQLHNAFRAPGATPLERFEDNKPLLKVDYYYEIYKEMHSAITPHAYFLSIENIDELREMSFVFVSVDKNAARHAIAKRLTELGIPFIDVGLGVNLHNNQLLGSLRVTKATKLKHDHLDNRIGRDELEENLYSNIQIADLNCLNATLAVISWKKHCGFYQDLKGEHNQLFFTSTGKLLNEDA